MTAAVPVLYYLFPLSARQGKHRATKGPRSLSIHLEMEIRIFGIVDLSERVRGIGENGERGDGTTGALSGDSRGSSEK